MNEYMNLDIFPLEISLVEINSFDEKKDYELI